MNLKIKDLYVVHYTKLVERKQNILTQFDPIVENIHFIEEYDQESLTDELISEWYQPSTEQWYERNNLWGKAGLPMTPFRIINLAEVSCTIKHIKALEKIAENGTGFIIEDDVLLVNNFLEEFNKSIDNLPNDWDIIMVGAGCNMHVKDIQKDIRFYRVPDPATRCLDSYLVTQSAAKKILSTIKPFQTISDWEFAWQFHINNLVTYWMEPSLCVQGSEIGLYKSTLR
jgi:GR25 family glycosyltransferase involved in LPS biosynthesis